MKQALFDLLKEDADFLEVYKEYNNNDEKGFLSLLKDSISFFISDFNIFLDKAYLDISYFIYKNRYINLDLLYSIFKEGAKEKGAYDA